MEEGERTSVRRPTARRTGRRVRVLLLIHVYWHWIRQRPQALAEELSGLADLDVIVLYLPNWRRRQLARNPSTVRRLPVPRLPFARFGVVRRLNDVVGKKFVAALTRLWHPSVTIVAFPTLLTLVPGPSTRGALVYDCMDLAVGFARSDSERRDVAALEDRLLRACDGVVVSSTRLETLIRPRLEPDVRIRLIRNGHGGSLVRVTAPTPDGPVRRLGYFGTISSGSTATWSRARSRPTRRSSSTSGARRPSLRRQWIGWCSTDLSITISCRRSPAASTPW